MYKDKILVIRWEIERHKAVLEDFKIFLSI